MSWSVHFIVTNGEIDQNGLDDIHAIKSQQIENTQQQKLLLDQAQALIASGAVGDPKGRFSVNLTGHANPGHKPVEGWANDWVSLAVSQHEI